EGWTPLVPAPALSERTGCDVWLKVEGANPTGSFKDRGMTVAVSAAVRDGAQAVLCASTGNTAASAAAYAARAGLRGAVIVPEGKIATGKLAQALMHGARVVALRGNFDQALDLVRELCQRHPIALVNSVNQFRLEGQKTAAFEVLEDLGGDVDAVCLPVGNAVSDAQILDAYRLLAAREGVFCEPASAASVAGLLHHGAGDAQRIVCVLTGHGLKDPQTALEQAGSVVPSEATIDAVERAVLG